jgi:hypothetical protein
LLAETVALRHDRRAACAVDRAVDAPTAHEPGVCRIHDGVDRLLGDVALNEFDFRHESALPARRYPIYWAHYSVSDEGKHP